VESEASVESVPVDLGVDHWGSPDHDAAAGANGHGDHEVPFVVELPEAVDAPDDEPNEAEADLDALESEIESEADGRRRRWRLRG